MNVTRIQSSEGPLQQLAPVVCQLGQHLQSTQDVAHLAGRPSAPPTRRLHDSNAREHALAPLLPRTPGPSAPQRERHHGNVQD